MTIRVMLVDDHCILRDTLRLFLAAGSDIEIVAEAGTAGEAFSVLAAVGVDVLVLDIGLPDGDGIEVARQVAKRHPSVRVLALSANAEKLCIDEMLKAGALGYVLKAGGAQELLSAIRAVAAGECFVSELVSRTLAQSVRAEGGAVTPPPSVLSRREKEVLRLVTRGERSAEIAASLGIALSTVEVHRRNIMQKLNLHSSVELTHYAIQRGLISS